ncbi:MAG: BrnT family toxin [Candidatus Hydrogenedentes bacterium]|nr:BrnT family toxin [Candidatus Hydrogenedentota bacterium]
MIYEWDLQKAKTNVLLHEVSFPEATSVFLDPLALTFPDPRHSNWEEREITLGQSERHRLLFVSHCRRLDRVRIISARKATKRERRQYEEGFGEENQ